MPNDKQKDYPEWIAVSEAQYMTIERPPPDSNQERIYIHDKDYRCNPWDRPDIYYKSTLTFKIHSDTPPETQKEDAPQELNTQLPPREDEISSTGTTKPIFLNDFPTSPNSIKESNAVHSRKDGDTYIPRYRCIPQSR